MRGEQVELTAADLLDEPTIPSPCQGRREEDVDFPPEGGKITGTPALAGGLGHAGPRLLAVLSNMCYQRAWAPTRNGGLVDHATYVIKVNKRALSSTNAGSRPTGS